MPECVVCGESPCVCAKKPVREWRLRECRVEGCSVVIRTPQEADPGPAFCKWHQDGVAHHTTRTVSPSGPVMDREEFGSALYDAIKICGGILQLQEMQDKADPKRLADLQTRERIMLGQLAAVSVKLSVQDQQDLMGRYPGLFE